MARGRTVLALVLAGLALVALAIVFIRPISDPDYWWHLRAAEELLETRQLPTTDPWSLTAELDDEPGGPDVLIWEYPPLTRAAYRQVILTGEWLSQIVLYGTWSVAGHEGTTVLAMLCMLAALALAFGFAWRSGAPAALCVLAACIAAWEVWGWGVPRPQIFTYVAATSFVWLFDRLRQGHRRILFVLPLLAALWSNLHLAYLVGVLIALAFVGGELVDRLLRRPSRPGLVALGLVLSLAGFTLNPNGLNSIPASLVQRLSLFASTIAEWQAPGFDRWVFFALLALAIVSVVLAVSTRQAPAAWAALALGFGAMGTNSYRHIPLFMFLGFPASVAALSRTVRAHFRRIPELGRLTRRAVTTPVQLGTLALAVFSAGGLAWKSRPHGFGTNEDWAPSALADHLNQLDVAGPIFNEYRFGGYLLWTLDPPRQLFIDGRSLSERANWEWDQTMAAQRPIYPFIFDRYRIDILALSPMSGPSVVSELVLKVAEDPMWVTTFVGSSSVVFVRRSALPDSGRSAPELRPDLYRAVIQQVVHGPGDDVSRSGNLAILWSRLDSLDLALALADEAFPVRQNEPATRPALIALALGKAAERAGRIDEAMAQYHLAPDHPDVMAALALLLARRAEAGQGEISGARQALRAAVAMGSCDPAVHEALDRLNEQPDDAEVADLVASGVHLAALRSADALLASGTDAARAQFFRGVALLRLCRYAGAEQAFRRSIEADGGLEAAPSPTLANLGWALFDGGRPDEALPVFESLLARNAADTQALYGAGLAYKFMGRREAARTFFERYLRIAPDDDPWIKRVRDNLEELATYRYFRGL